MKRTVRRIPILALSTLAALAGCMDPLDDEDLAAELGESTAELLHDLGTEFTPARVPVTPSVFRGFDYNVQMIAINQSGQVGWDIQTGLVWGTPNLSRVGDLLYGVQAIAAAQQQDGKTVVWARVGSNLYYTRQRAPYSRSWDNWTAAGFAAPSLPLSMAANKDGRLELVYLFGTTVHRRWQTGVNGGWSPPFNTGVAATRPPKIHRDSADHLEIFVPVATPNCGIKRWRQMAADSTAWSTPRLDSGPCLLDLAVNHQGTRTEIFARGTNNYTYRSTRNVPGYNFTSPVAQAVPATSAPTLHLKDDGRLVMITWLRQPQGSTDYHFLYESEISSSGVASPWSQIAITTAGLEVAADESMINQTELYVAATPSGTYQRMKFN